MKKKIIAIFTIAAVFALAIAAYAYTQTSISTTPSASCCKDSCPMKKKDGDHGKDHAKDEGHSCCGDSCPMKKKGGEHAEMEGHTCCGDSCPMKKKEGQATTVPTAGDDKGCCEDCDCCKGKAKTETAHA